MQRIHVTSSATQSLPSWPQWMLLCVFFLVGCGTPPEPKLSATITGATMGTSYLIKITHLPAETSQEHLQAVIDSELEKINDQMSTYRPMSEISLFNRHSGQDWFAVSPETAQVVHKALFVNEETQGAFDITVGPLVNLWGFGPEQRERIIPSAAEINAVRAKTGRRHLEVRLSPPALRKLHRDAQIDLSAIAKGFGVDKVAELLDGYGIDSYLVEIGGEVRARGAKTDGSAWLVGIEMPSPERRIIQEVISLRDNSLATSGDYRNFFEHNGKRYSHTIDPRTGRPVEHGLASVTVVADTCMQADAWATALMVLGPEKGYDFAEKRGLAALFIVHAHAGMTSKTTPAFERRLHEQ